MKPDGQAADPGPRSLLRRGLAALLPAALALPALLPLLSGRLLSSADGQLHLYRLLLLDRLLREGVLFSRWWPDLAYGYGLPLFNYYAPLAYYLSEPLTVLGLPLELVLNLSLALSLLAGAYGMCLWVRALWEAEGQGAIAEGPARLGAWLAAAAYLYAPYLLFNALARANLAEAWALGLAPWALWAYTRWVRRPWPGTMTTAALLPAAVMLCHNVTGLLFAVLMAGYAGAWGLRAFLARAPRSQSFLSVLFHAGLPLVLALALSAFFWLPALLEQADVQIERVIVTPDFDFRFHFSSLADLVAWLPQANTGRLNTAWPATLGVGQALVGIAGILSVFVNARRVKLETGRTDRGPFSATGPFRATPVFAAWPVLLFLLLYSLAIVALMLPVASPVWERIPFLPFVQDPARLRGMFALAWAPFTGLALGFVPRRLRGATAAVAVLALALPSFPLLFPRVDPQVAAQPSTTTMFEYEGRTGALGTTSFGEYLPVWVQDVPDHSPLEEQYTRVAVPDRFVWPEGARVVESNAEPLRAQARVSLPAGARVVWRSFYFPGWRVSVDGQSVQVLATVREGLVSFNVPAGERTVEIAYAGTPVERAAEGLSLGSALALAVGAAAWWKSRARGNLVPQGARAEGAARGAGGEEGRQRYREAAGLLRVAALLVAAKLVSDRVDTPVVAHFDPDHPAMVAPAPAKADFGGRLELIGSDLAPQAALPGQVLKVKLFWRAERSIEGDYAVALHLLDAGGTLRAQSDHLHPAGLPTSRWDPAGYVEDLHSLVLPGDLASGNYALVVRVYLPPAGPRLPVQGAEGYPLGVLPVR